MTIVVVGQRAVAIKASGPHRLVEARDLAQVLHESNRADMVLMDVCELRKMLQNGCQKRTTSAKIQEALESLKRSNLAAKEVLASNG